MRKSKEKIIKLSFNQKNEKKTVFKAELVKLIGLGQRLPLQYFS